MARVVHAAAPDIAKKGNGQPLGIDPVDGTTAELVLPEDQDRGLSRDRAAARSRRQKCDHRWRRNLGAVALPRPTRFATAVIAALEAAQGC